MAAVYWGYSNMPNNFQNGLKGLLDSGMLGDIGAGLLASSGYSTMPTTMGQAMGNGMMYANQRQAEQVGLQQARNQITQQQNRDKSLKELQGLFAPGQTPGPVVSPTAPAISTPEGQARMQSLLFDVAPEFATEQMIKQQYAQAEKPRVSTAMNDYQMLNPDQQPGTPEFREGFMDFAANQDSNLADQVQLQLNSLALENARRERDQQERTQAQEAAGTKRAVYSDLSKLKEMADINSRLQDSFLSSGMVAPDTRRSIASITSTINQALGNDTTQAQSLIADYDRFKKLSQDFVIGSIDRFAGNGTMTNSKFDALMNANASLGASPQANNLIFADNISAILDAAEAEGINIPNVSEYRDLAKSLKTANPVQPTGRNITTMPLQDLLNMDTSTLSNSERSALEKRLDDEGY